MTEPNECMYCGDTERPCVCDDLETHARAVNKARVARARTKGAAEERDAICEKLASLQATVESRTAGELDPTACRTGLRYVAELREFAEWLSARGKVEVKS